jgi:hypothetical protein
MYSTGETSTLYIQRKRPPIKLNLDTERKEITGNPGVGGRIILKQIF